MKRFLRATGFAHRLIRERLQTGDVAVDATAGNGHDTAFLATCVGDSGKVFAFDIQEEAIRATGERCANFPQVELIHAGHEQMDLHVSEPVKAVMFNLGYLPNGDKSKITEVETTIIAIRTSLRLLARGGLLTCILYRGHIGGEAEAEAVESELCGLDQDVYTTIRYEFLNQRNSPPALMAVEKR
ncbi:MAG: class I SAM-dependent methyltransferase [Verrucomicrobiales bacterium]|nr:class I SAM-dependent methyltransferase [Verrucomicrobiales bacterium]